MRELLRDYFDGRLSRRGFLHRLVASGFTVAAAGAILDAADADGQTVAAGVPGQAQPGRW